MAEPLDTIEHQSREIDALFENLASSETDHRSVLSDLTTSMAAHISVEHSIVLPVVRATGCGDRTLPRELKRDYRRMGHRLMLIERRKINSPDLPQMITALGSDWDRHVAHHRQLRGINELMSESDREALAQKMDRAESVILSHPHPHLLSLGPLSRITTRLAARFDRARDRTVPNLP